MTTSRTETDVHTERWPPDIGDLDPCHNKPTGYETNKPEHKSEVENGTPPWVVAWAEDITETDAAEGVIAGVGSVFGANPAPFIAWVENLVNRTISTLVTDAEKRFPEAIKNEVNQLAQEAIKAAIQGKSAKEVLKNYDTVDFKAGAIKYSGKNKACGVTLSTTWGLVPYVAFRWR
ncbi:hypothetical protein [Bacillus cereus]|uniref:hypothetical protein n=1 Tax=Bacillus cereus TaxID=1396 RepID=UPI000BF9E7A3|nr:hypothetical protein [Bacillus cereus]PFF14709.1 hypothetical protein CN343_07145 [Bacillus cereus]